MSSGLHALLERKKPSKWSLFLSNPVIFLAQKFYSRRGKVELELSLPVTTVVCISDTHNRQFDIPEGDILLHAGDLTQSGSKSEIQAAVDWLNALPHNHKVVIARNHDLLLAQERSRANRGGSTETGNLESTGARDLPVVGTGLLSTLGQTMSGGARFHRIPIFADPCSSKRSSRFGHPGMRISSRRAMELGRRPRSHVFGHVHEGHGQEWAMFNDLQRAYDDVMKDNGGGMGLLRVVYQFVLTLLRPRRTEPGTLMVNAAIVGGLRDEVRQRPVVVHL